MVYIAQNWLEHMAQMGNVPGPHQGDVTVYLVPPLEFEGSSQLTVPSSSVTIAAEAGDTMLYQIILPDGRRLTLEPTSVVGIVDARPDQ